MLASDISPLFAAASMMNRTCSDPSIIVTTHHHRLCLIHDLFFFFRKDQHLFISTSLTLFHFQTVAMIHFRKTTKTIQLTFIEQAGGYWKKKKKLSGPLGEELKMGAPRGRAAHPGSGLGSRNAVIPAGMRDLEEQFHSKWHVFRFCLCCFFFFESKLLSILNITKWINKNPDIPFWKKKMQIFGHLNSFMF